MTEPLRIVFAGTPEFAAEHLKALLASPYDIVAVYTQPDRPAGRGQKLMPSPVKQLALEHNIPVLQPPTLRNADAQAELAALKPDLLVVVAYGLILPQAVLDIPRLGCINSHASLLPRWRGAAPLQRALLAGDRESGVCIMQMEAGLDTGPILLQEAVIIDASETTASLHDKLAHCGAELIVRALARLPLPAVPQPSAGITYAHKIDKAEASIDWQQSATHIDRQIRAFNPFPGAQTTLAGQRLKLWQARPHAGQGEPGRILAIERDAIIVACGEGALALSELQKAGGKRLPAREFLAGHPLQPGDRLGEA